MFRKENPETHVALMLKQFDQFQVELIKANKPDIVGLDGMTLLQKAAALGNIKSVLWCLYAGAEIDLKNKKNPFSPLYLAVKDGHWLVAQILIFCGANITKAEEIALTNEKPEIHKELSKLSVDLDVIQTVIFWAITNYDPKYKNALLERIKPQLSRFVACQDHVIDVSDKQEESKDDDEKESDLATIELDSLSSGSSHSEAIDFSAYAELALEKKLPDVARFLFELNHYRVRTIPNAATFGYLAAKLGEPDLFSLISKDDEHVALSIYQMYENRQKNLYKKYKKQCTPNQLKLLSELQKKHGNADNSSDNQAEIFDIAKFGNIDLLESDVSDVEATDRCLSVSRGVEQDNFVVVGNLLDHCNNQKLAQIAINEKNRELLILLMFTRHLDILDVALENPTQVGTLLELLGSDLQQSGLLLQIIGKLTSHFKSDAKEEEKLIQLITHLENVSLEKLFSIYLMCVYQRSTINFEEDFDQLDNKNKDQFSKIAKLFGHDISLKINLKFRRENFITRLPKDLKFLIASFLTAPDKTALCAVSKTIYDSQTNLSFYLIQRFQAQLEKEIAQMSFLAHREYKLTNFQIKAMITFGLAMAGFILTTCLVAGWEGEQREIRHQLEDINYKDKDDWKRNCYSKALLFGDVDSCYRPSDKNFENACGALCDALEINRPKLIGAGTVLAVCGLLLLVLPCSTYRGLKSLIETFSEDRLQRLTIKAFSPSLQKQMTNLFQEFDPEFDLEVPSSISVVKDRIKKLEKDLSSSVKEHHRLFNKRVAVLPAAEHSLNTPLLLNP